MATFPRCGLTAVRCAIQAALRVPILAYHATNVDGNDCAASDRIDAKALTETGGVLTLPATPFASAR